MPKAKLFYVGIKGLIRNSQGQYLLLHANVATHSRGTKVYWDIPGGRIDEGGDVLSTLTREIEEETGVTDVSNIKFLTAVVSNHEVPLDNGGKAGLVLMVYTANIPENSTIKLNPEEHLDYEWVEPAEAAKRLANKYPDEFTSQLS